MTTKNIPPYYTNQSIQRVINVSFIETSIQIKDLLYQKIKNEVEGKCIREGYVRPDSIKIVLAKTLQHIKK